MNKASIHLNRFNARGVHAVFVDANSFTQIFHVKKEQRFKELFQNESETTAIIASGSVSSGRIDRNQ